jgi:hypothetical protein
MTLIGAWEVRLPTLVLLAAADGAAYEGKIATATPCGNFMLFDVNKAKLGGLTRIHGTLSVVIPDRSTAPSSARSRLMATSSSRGVPRAQPRSGWVVTRNFWECCC